MEIQFEGLTIVLDPLAPLSVGETYMQKRPNTGWYLDEVKSIQELDGPYVKGTLVIGKNGWGETRGNYKIIEMRSDDN